MGEIKESECQIGRICAEASALAWCVCTYAWVLLQEVASPASESEGGASGENLARSSRRSSSSSSRSARRGKVGQAHPRQQTRQDDRSPSSPSSLGDLFPCFQFHQDSKRACCSTHQGGVTLYHSGEVPRSSLRSSPFTALQCVCVMRAVRRRKRGGPFHMFNFLFHEVGTRFSHPQYTAGQAAWAAGQ